MTSPSSQNSVKHKVLAYITRQQNGQTQLLVFTHRDHPDAGVQVPAGTVDVGEAPEAALFREIQEESGLTTEQLQLARKLAEVPKPWGHIRHFYHLRALAVPEQWQYTVQGQGEDVGLVFDYRWIDIQTAHILSGEQAEQIGAIN